MKILTSINTEHTKSIFCMIAELTGNCATYIGGTPAAAAACDSCDDGYGLDEAATCSTHRLKFP